MGPHSPPRIWNCLLRMETEHRYANHSKRGWTLTRLDYDPGREIIYILHANSSQLTVVPRSSV